MAASMVENLRDAGFDTSRECISATPSMLRVLYGQYLTETFDTVGGVDGNMCFCQKNLCNIYMKPREEHASSSQMLIPNVIMLILTAAVLL